MTKKGCATEVAHPLESRQESREDFLREKQSGACAPVADDYENIVDVGDSVTIGIAFGSIPVAEHDQDVIDVDDIVTIQVAFAWNLRIDHFDITQDGPLVEDLESPDLTAIAVERGAWSDMETLDVHDLVPAIVDMVVNDLHGIAGGNLEVSDGEVGGHGTFENLAEIGGHGFDGIHTGVAGVHPDGGIDGNQTIAVIDGDIEIATGCQRPAAAWQDQAGISTSREAAADLQVVAFTTQAAADIAGEITIVVDVAEDGQCSGLCGD